MSDLEFILISVCIGLVVLVIQLLFSIRSLIDEVTTLEMEKIARELPPLKHTKEVIE